MIIIIATKTEERVIGRSDRGAMYKVFPGGR